MPNQSYAASNAMTKATPEQIRVFRHRRWVAALVSIGIVISGGLLMFGLLSLDVVHKDGHTAIAVGFSTVILTAIVGSIFQFLYFRCPVCGHSIPHAVTGRGLIFGHRCNHCDIDFTA